MHENGSKDTLKWVDASQNVTWGSLKKDVKMGHKIHLKIIREKFDLNVAKKCN